MYTWEAYRLMLWLPLVVGALVVALAAIIGDSLTGLGPLGTAIGSAALVFAAAPVVAGVPYLVFAVLVANWSHGRSDRQIRRVVNLSPILFIPVLAGFWLAVSMLSGTVAEQFRHPPAHLLLNTIAVTLAVGYGLVLLAHLIVLALRRAGMVVTV
jgi:hypothetical protein